MKKNISIHLALFALLIAAFYAAGLVDKARLDASNADTRKVPLFSHTECYFLDGGSIGYDSFVYSAFESRRLEDVKDEDGRVLGGWSGYQGYTWRWHHLNTLWIAALLALSFMIVARRLSTQKKSAEQVSGGNGGQRP